MMSDKSKIVTYDGENVCELVTGMVVELEPIAGSILKIESYGFTGID